MLIAELLEVDCFLFAEQLRPWQFNYSCSPVYPNVEEVVIFFFFFCEVVFCLTVARMEATVSQFLDQRESFLICNSWSAMLPALC